MKKSTDAIINQSLYLSETINTFTNFIKKDKKVSRITVQNEISKAISIIESVLKNKFIKLNIEMNESPIILDAIEGELLEVLINILTNSKDVLLERNIEKPFIQLKLLSDNKNVTISIEDNAGGIDKNVIPHIFEPYFTTKHQSIGTGLGLYISYKIVSESLKGTLEVSNMNKGVKFKIVFPLKDIKS